MESFFSSLQAKFDRGCEYFFLVFFSNFPNLQATKLLRAEEVVLNLCWTYCSTRKS